jgi:hypothetical protein
LPDSDVIQSRSHTAIYTTAFGVHQHGMPHLIAHIKMEAVDESAAYSPLPAIEAAAPTPIPASDNKKPLFQGA